MGTAALRTWLFERCTAECLGLICWSVKTFTKFIGEWHAPLDCGGDPEVDRGYSVSARSGGAGRQRCEASDISFNATTRSLTVSSAFVDFAHSAAPPDELIGPPPGPHTGTLHGVAHRRHLYASLSRWRAEPHDPPERHEIRSMIRSPNSPLHRSIQRKLIQISRRAGIYS